MIYVFGWMVCGVLGLVLMQLEDWVECRIYGWTYTKCTVGNLLASFVFGGLVLVAGVFYGLVIVVENAHRLKSLSILKKSLF